MRLLYKLILSATGRWGLVKNVLLALFSGLASFLFIGLLNLLMSKIIKGKIGDVTLVYVVVLFLIVSTFVLTKRILGARIVILSQTLFWKLRKQILFLVLHTSYRQLVQKRAEINIALNSDVNALSSASYGIIDFVTNIIIAVATLIYLASISIQLFIATILTAFFGVFFYSRGQKNVDARFAEAIRLENVFMQKANAILDGFKEIFIDPGKGRDIFENDLNAAGEQSKEINLLAQTSMMNGQAMVQLLFYVLVSSVLLFAAHITSLSPDEVIKFIFTLLFLVGSISTVVMQLPGLIRANASYKHLAQLTKELESLPMQTNTTVAVRDMKEFHSIDIKGIQFYYDKSGDSFKIGAFDFYISRGELVFIYGGNGSGKTTFIYTLIGVYITDAGEIRLNSELVSEESYPAYRSAFAVVCSDFYLFEELYGLEKVNMPNWDFYIDIFELNGLVTLDGKKFSTTKLSTGQRKRLAIIAALLEEKPVLVLDEWAADQDPIFRKKFYTIILPVLMDRGITIIAITHDDKYYHCADRLYRMEEGMLIQEEMKIDSK